MVGAYGNHSEVIGKPPGFDIHGFHFGDPWVKSETGEHHAERAALWDAALLSVGFAKSSTDAVVVMYLFMECRIGSEDGLGEASHFKKIIQELALSLVEAFPYVAAASSEIHAREPRHF